MLGSQDHEGNAKSRIRTGSVNRQLSIDAGNVKAEFQTFTAPDPVFLHRLNAFRPAVQKFQIIQKFFRIIGNFEEPLFQIFFDDLMVTAPAASVDNLLISQNSVAFTTPVDSRFFLDGQTALIKQLKEPLGPFIVIFLTGGNFAVPIIGQSQFLLLTGHVGDIFHRPFSRVDTMFDRGILSRHTKRIPAHRMQHVKTVHTAEAGNYVADGIIAYVPHMQVARRIREHFQHIRLGFACINISFKCLVIFPIFLPFAFYGMGNILFFDHSSHNLLKFAYHRSAANKKVPGC